MRPEISAEKEIGFEMSLYEADKILLEQERLDAKEDIPYGIMMEKLNLPLISHRDDIKAFPQKSLKASCGVDIYGVEVQVSSIPGQSVYFRREGTSFIGLNKRQYEAYEDGWFDGTEDFISLSADSILCIEHSNGEIEYQYIEQVHFSDNTYVIRLVDEDLLGEKMVAEFKQALAYQKEFFYEMSCEDKAY